jgi:subtilisin family serine protease
LNKSKIAVYALVIAVFLISIIPQTITVAESRVRVIIGVKGPDDLNTIKRLCLGCNVHLEILELNVIVIEAPRSIINYLSKLPFVRYIEEDKPVRAFEEVQWNIEMINATDVWSTYSLQYGDAAYGYNPTIRVAVLDTGVDYQHVDLQGAVTYCIVSLRNTKTYYEGTNLKNCADPNGHGTHVAGIIAARLNGQGVAGVAPKVLLYAVRVLDASGSGYVSDVAKGIVEATKGPDDVAGTDDDADVISMSLGGPDSSVLYDAVKYAYNYNVTLVAAAGNDGASQPSCPACYPEVIAVGAVDSNYNVPDWSNRNPDVVAPGVNILSTWPKNRYAYASGTSMACPHVSGTVALIQALRLATGLRKLTPSEIQNILTSTAIDLGAKGYDELYGYGLVDAFAAVNAALNTP